MALFTQAAEGAADSFAPLDMVGLGLVGLLVVLGLWRGLWWQVIRLVGILAAVVLARAFSNGLSEQISTGWPELSPRLAYGVAWFGIFLGAMSVATLLGLLGQRMLRAMHLGIADRIGGGLVGAVTGVAGYVAVLIALVQLAPESFVGEVVAGTYSEKLVDAVGNRWQVVIDGDAAEEVRKLLEGVSEEAPDGPVR